MTVHAHTPGIERLMALDAPVHELPRGFDIGGGPSAGWGRGCDGPFWIVETHALAFSDVGNHRRLTWSLAEGVMVLDELTNRAIGTTRDGSGRIVSCEWATGRVTRREHDGRVSIVADSYAGHRLNRPDDVVVSSDGSIYFTDVRDPFTDIREPFAVPLAESTPASGLYRVAPDLGSIELLVDDCEEPGGLALSPDGRTLYLADPRRSAIRSYQVARDGTLSTSSPRVFATVSGPGAAAPFGLAVDIHGNLYCGGPGGIWVIDPQGVHLGTVLHPASRTTNLAWGGDDGHVLFFTTPVGVGYIETRSRGALLPVAPADAAAVRPWARRPVDIDRGIVCLDPRLEGIVSRGASVVELASGGVFDDLVGGPSHRFSRSLEGVVWVETDDSLLFSDIGNNRRLKWTSDGVLSVSEVVTNHANGAALDTEGRLVSCEHSSRRVTRREHDGSTTVVADHFEGSRLSRPNDVVVRSDGTIYFTAPWWDFGSSEEREVDFNGVFRVPPDLAGATAVVRDFVLPNGLCFSPDESVLYIDDTRRSHIRAFDVLPNGDLDLSSDRVFAELEGDGPGRPDGMKVDADGNLYCGGPGGLWILSPEGVHLGTIVHGATQTNNPAFGGADRKTLYFVTWVSLGCVRVEIPGAPVPAPARDPLIR